MWKGSAVLGAPGVQNVTGIVAEALDTTKELITLNTTGANALLTLADSLVGDRLVILMEADNGDVVVTGTFVGGTTATFDTILDSVDMIMTTAGWSVLSSVGAVAIA